MHGAAQRVDNHEQWNFEMKLMVGPRTRTYHGHPKTIPKMLKGRWLLANSDRSHSEQGGRSTPSRPGMEGGRSTPSTVGPLPILTLHATRSHPPAGPLGTFWGAVTQPRIVKTAPEMRPGGPELLLPPDHYECGLGRERFTGTLGAVEEHERGHARGAPVDMQEVCLCQYVMLHCS